MNLLYRPSRNRPPLSTAPPPFLYPHTGIETHTLSPKQEDQMVLSVREKVRRRWENFRVYITPDYWDLDPVHVAHRSLAAAQERALKAEQEREQEEQQEGSQEENMRAFSSIAASWTYEEDGGKGEGSCDDDIEAAGDGVSPDENRASQENLPLQAIWVRGQGSQMYAPNRATERMAVAPYYQTREGGTLEQEQRNKAYFNWCTRLFLIMDEPNWK